LSYPESAGAGGKRYDRNFYSFTQLYSPQQLFTAMITGGESVLSAAAGGFQPDDYETKQVFYSSKDGTRCAYVYQL